MIKYNYYTLNNLFYTNKMSGDIEYSQDTQLEHVLGKPAMYVGSIRKQTSEIHLYNSENHTFELKKIKFVPAWYKILDEVLVNALDHWVNFKEKVNLIKINFSKKDGSIQITNNGPGISLKKFITIEKEEIYLPQAIASAFRMGSNLDPNKKRITGGTHGLGLKLCLEANTRIPMWNGEIKQIKDIEVGELLIGDDGKQRKVLNKITGTGALYKVTQSNGESYTINENHILSLAMVDHKTIFWNSVEGGWCIYWIDTKECKIKSKTFIVAQTIECDKCGEKLSRNLKSHYYRKHQGILFPKKSRYLSIMNPLDSKKVREMRKKAEEFVNTLSDDNIIDISVADYMKLNKTFKSRLCGFQGHCVEWADQEVELDPYVLGLWLGDDHQNDYGNQKSYGYSSNDEDDPLKKYLDKYNITNNNKRIPNQYLVNSRKVRLALLTGFIDSDGTCKRNGTRMVITQGMNNKDLAEDLTLLIRSLGIRCSKNIQKIHYTLKGELRRGEAIVLNLSGENLKDIPTSILRKKYATSIKHNTCYNGSITITKIPDGEFVGLQIDGNQRFVLEDFTVTHNCNAYSDYLKLITVVNINGKIKKYTQIFKNQLSIIEDPVIEDMPDNTQEYTSIKFLPCYSKMGYSNLTEEDYDNLYNLVQTRSYQASAFIDAEIYFNKEKISLFQNQNEINCINSKKCNKFIAFANMFIKNSYGLYHTIIINPEHRDLNWEICIGVSDGKFRQVSLINGIYVYKGGNHIKHIQNEIVNNIKSKVEKALSKKNKFNQNYIINNLFIIFKASMDRPSFNSQIKSELDDPIEDFSNYKFKKSEWVKIWEFLESHIMSQFLEKVSDKKKTRVARGKVDLGKGTDATYAGHKTKAKQTSLIICEGDSAMGTIHRGITHKKTELNYDYYGTFSIQGVPMNARKECKQFLDKVKLTSSLIRNKKLQDNKRFDELIRISGLDYGKTYDPDTMEGKQEFETLRYGRIIVAVDQDEDGKGNIFGLIVNFILLFWPNLSKWNYIKRLNTPIIRAYLKGSKSKENIEFYSLAHYNNWIQDNFDGDNDKLVKKYFIKYYKGLGTHDQKRGEIYPMFNNFEDKLLNYTLDDMGEKNLEIYYGKDTSSRKIVLATPLDKNDELLCDNNIPVSLMLKTDVKEFQRDNILRKLPHVIDGMVPSRRKVFYAARHEFGTTKITNKEVKVCNFTGAVMKFAHYHHGEASLNETIIKMCQDFPGAKNMPMLIGIGEFGTRNEGGKDHASPRYVELKLNQKLCNAVCPREDDFLLQYEFNDGIRCEPSFYIPILPLSIMENMEIPATGWKAKIWARDYKQVIKNIKWLISGKITKCKPMTIWLKDNNSDIRVWNKKTYAVGKYYYDEKTNRINITELPPCVYDTSYINSVLYNSTTDDKGETKKVMKPEFIDYRSDSRYDEEKNKYEIIIWFELKDSDTINTIRNFNRSGEEIKDYPFDGVEDFMNLKLCLSSNLNLIKDDGTVKEYTKYHHIVDDWFIVRKQLYKERIERMIILTSLMIRYLKNIIKFSKERDDYNITNRTPENEFNIILANNKYDTFNKTLLFSPRYTKVEELEGLIINNIDKGTSYDYIINLTYKQLLKETCNKRQKQLEEEEEKLKELLDDSDESGNNFKGKKIWLKEINEIETIIEDGIKNGWGFDEGY
jgi:DNA topoisomerase II